MIRLFQSGKAAAIVVGPWYQPAVQGERKTHGIFRDRRRRVRLGPDQASVGRASLRGSGHRQGLLTTRTPTGSSVFFKSADSTSSRCTSPVEALSRLGDEIGSPPIEVFVIGGAAMALTFHERRTTQDVDVVINSDEDRDRILAAGERIRSEFGLPEDWINEKAK